MTDNIIFFHGFTQTKVSYEPFIKELEVINRHKAGRQFNFITFDLPGHGSAGDIKSTYKNLLKLIDPHLPAHFFGYSLGARLAAKCALERTKAILSLTLVSCNPGINDTSHRMKRISQDQILAKKIREMSRNDLKDFIDNWVTQPLFGTDIPAPKDIAARYLSDPKGLADSLIKFGQGNFKPLWNKLNLLSKANIRVLVLAGERDSKYKEIAFDIKESFGPTAELKIVKDRYHSPHLEDSKAVAEIYATFLNLITNYNTSD